MKRITASRLIYQGIGIPVAAASLWIGARAAGGWASRSSDFMPHGYCYLWDPGMVWLHVMSDGLITLSYYAIPVILIYFIRRNRDLPFNRIFWMFGGFILACGTTHLMEIWNVWHGSYLLAGVIKAATAAVSVVTAAMLVPLVPKAISLPGLQAVNLKLEEQAEELSRQTEQLLQSQRALEAQSLTLKLVLDCMGEGLVAADREGHFLIWNNSANKLMGREAADLPTEPWTPHCRVFMTDGITPYPPDRLPLARALRGESVQVELMVEHPGRADGVFLEVSARPLKDNQGNLGGGVAVLHDITERKRTEAAMVLQAEELLSSQQALETQTLMLRSVLDSIGEGLVAVDETGKFILWNPAATRIVGLGAANIPPEQWTNHYGTYLPDTVTPFPAEQNPLLRAMHGEVGSAEMFVRNPELDEGVWIEASASPLRDKDGVARGGVVAFRDITQRRTDEREIRKLNEELEERVIQRTAQLAAANHELEAFTYSVSHDLRAPLRHIGGFSRILMEDFGPAMEPEARHHVERIEDGVRRMGLLVDELLNLAQLGRHALKLQATELSSIVEEVVSVLQPEVAGRVVIWKIGNLPPVNCDPILVKQVFQNLVANALKFTRPRDQAVIEIGYRQDGPELVFLVRDNGIGFSMKYKDKLFGVFQRLHRAEDFEGTGIGLATVQRIVHKHGGQVWADSELDKGATFYFTLAAADADGVKAAQFKSEAETSEDTDKRTAAGATL